MPELLLQGGQVRRNLEQEKGFWWSLPAGGPVGPGARKQEAPLSSGLTEHWTRHASNYPHLLGQVTQPLISHLKSKSGSVPRGGNVCNGGWSKRGPLDDVETHSHSKGISVQRQRPGQ